MANQHSRRDFIAQTGKGTLALGLSPALLSVFNTGCKVSQVQSTLFTGFTQSPLPYKYNELEPVIDAMTMEIHYSKHAAAYAKNLNEAADAENVDKKAPLEKVLEKISKYSEKMRNNGGGHYNHELFWSLMQAGKTESPDGKILKAISYSFGSLEAFKTEFGQAALNRFGSGWAWLVVDADKKLRIGSTANQDNPLMDVSTFKGRPVMALDIWEHAYYLKYQNRRAEYVANWWKVVNWDAVETRYLAALK